MFQRIVVLSILLLFAGQSFAMSEEKEIEIGRKMHAEILSKTPRYADEELQAYVNDLGQLLASHSERPHLEWHFTVLDSKDINAFATPGGYVYLNSGLMTYLQSEAQLAGVLGHEIGHITGHHASRQTSAARWSQALSTIAAVAVGVGTGSGQAANATRGLGDLAGTALVRGYGRDMELEADGSGAKYLRAAGYPPQAMISVIGALKDQERFSRLKAKSEGKQAISYHGVFSTHPRNDQRLQNVVKEVGALEASKAIRGNDGLFERHMDGFKFLETSLNIKTVGSRYMNRPMDFTLAFPSGWSVKTRGAVIQGRGPKDSAVVQLRVQRLKDDVSPETYLRDVRQFSNLEQGESLNQDERLGFTGIVPATGPYPRRRVAVIYHKNRVFMFTAQADNSALQNFYDTLFMATLWSFRPLSNYEKNIALARQLTWIQVGENTSFAELAKHSPVKNFAEEELRLINGYYPSGEPKPGTWLRIIE